MDLNIQKDQTSNWFKLLQDVFCNDISVLENHKIKLLLTRQSFRLMGTINYQNHSKQFEGSPN